MTQEDKELLLKDLCARLPYHPNCSCKWLEKAPNGTNGYVQELSTFVIDEIEIMDDPQFKCQICDVKPYLRPMSSMTEDEHNDWCRYYQNAEMEELNKSGDYFKAAISGDNAKYDWLNAHHFDYRGLIDVGLALEAPEDMYKI